jgi:hypothetical protein
MVDGERGEESSKERAGAREAGDAWRFYLGSWSEKTPLCCVL